MRLRRAGGGRGPEVVFDWGGGYEALLALAMFTGDEPQPSYEVGRRWFTAVRKRASPALQEGIRRLTGGAGQQWFLLLGMVHAAAGQRDLAALLAHVKALPPEEIQRTLLGAHLPPLRTDAGRRSIDAALAGDPDGIAALAKRCPEMTPSLVRRLLALGPAQAQQQLCEVLRRWESEVFTPMGLDATPVLEADASTRRRQTAGLSMTRTVEAVTDGLVYDGEAGIDQVVLVPSVIQRPFVAWSEWDSTKFIVYRAARRLPDDALPRPDMVAVYRALGDDTRLRILRSLAGGDRGVSDLAKQLALAKSTVHAHLVVLRMAGLVRVTIGAEKRYGLRDALPDLSGLLHEYLEAP